MDFFLPDPTGSIMAKSTNPCENKAKEEEGSEKNKCFYLLCRHKILNREEMRK